MIPLKAVIISLLLTYSGAQVTDDADQLLNWCLDGKNHKTKPGPESQLFAQVCHYVTFKTTF